MKRVRKFLSAGAVLATIAVVFALYAVKNDTRALDNRVDNLERMVARTRNDIAVLRAEWAHVTQPGWIAGLARKHLDLRPSRPGQYITPDDLDNRARLAPKPEDRR